MGKTTETLEFLINASPQSAIKGFKDVGDAADKHLTKAQTKSEETAASLVKFGAGAVAVAGIIGAGLVKMGADFDKAYDKIRTQTGATGDTLKGLQGDFKATLAQVPSSMGETSDAIATLNQKLGLTGAPLQALAVQFLNLSHLTGTDVKTNLAAATGAFNLWGISAEQQGGKLDELFRVTQASGVSFDTLTSALSTSGAALRGVGLSFDESAGLLGLLAKNGLDASTVIPALSKAMATAAKNGQSASDVFRTTFEAIKNAPTDVAAAGIALDVFGAKAGPKFAELIRGGTLAYDDFAKALGNSGDTINKAAADTYDFGEKLAILRNKLEVAIEPAVSSAFDNLTSVVGVLGDAFAALPAPVTAAAGNILLFGTAALGIAGGVSFVAGEVGKLIGVAEKMGGALADAGGAAAKLGPALATAGPYLAGLAVAIGAVAIVMSSQGDIVNEATAAYDKFTTSINDTSKAIASSFQELEKAAIGNDTVAKSAVTLGQTTSDLLKVLGSDAPGAIGDYSAALHTAAGSSKEGQAAADLLQGALSDIKWSEYIAGAVQLNAAMKTLGIDGIIAAATAAGSSTTSIDALRTALSNGDINATILSQTGINLGGTLDGVRTAADSAKVGINGVQGAAEKAIPSEKELKDAAEKAAKAFQAQQDAALSLIDTHVGYTRSVEDVGTALGDFQQSQVDATDAVTKYGPASDEAAKAQKGMEGSSRSLEDSISKAAAAAVLAAQDQATLEGATFTTSDKVNAQIGALEALKAKFPELAPAIDAHIQQLDKIPHEKKTDVVVDTGDSSQNLENIIDKMNSLHDKTIHVNAIGGVNVNGAAEGGSRSGLVLVGEKGPELVALPKGSFVYTNSQTRGMLDGVPGYADGGIVLPAWTPPNSVNPTWGLGQELPYSITGGVKTSAPYMGPLGTGDMLLDPVQVAAINAAGNDQFGMVNMPAPPTPEPWKPFGVGPNDYKAPAGTTIININMPPGSNGEDVVQALKRYERRNGTVPVHTL